MTHPDQLPLDTPPPAPRRTEDQERNAMRAFLQRSEVRLSTMHRVAVGFLSGAGLLFLLPIFFKDAILIIVRELIDYPATMPPEVTSYGAFMVVFLYSALIYPFVLSVGVPVVALVQLLRDIVRFYFTGHAPGFPETYFNPRFALTGIAFSPDESESIKSKVMIHQYGSDLINFIVPFDEVQAHYYDQVIDYPERNIVPRTRKLPLLVRGGILHVASDKELRDLNDEDALMVSRETQGTTIIQDERQRSVKDVDRFNAALGLAGFVERPLHQEVAKTEVSLVRHALNLRRLVLRYFQALLIFLWTIFLSFGMLPFLNDTRIPNLLVFTIGYFLWALITPIVVELPVRWLISYFPPENRRTVLAKLEQSDGMQRFARRVKLVCYASILLSAIAVVLEVWLRFGA